MVIIGGEIDMPDAGVYRGGIIPNSNPVEYYKSNDEFMKMRRGLVISGWTGVCHIEGLWIHGEDLAEGINANNYTLGSVLQMQNVRVDNVHSRVPEEWNNWGGNHHPDVFQTWAGTEYFYIDRLTGFSDYQGFMLQPHQGHAWYTALAKFKNVDLRAILPPGTTGGTYMIYDNGGYTDTELTNVWMFPRTGGGVWPSTSVNFRNSTDPTRCVNQGTAPTDNYVPSCVPGVFYMTPGYL